VKVIQILSHQFKISSRVELFYFVSPNPSDDDSGGGDPYDDAQRIFDNALNFQKVGYFSFDANHSSEYQAREMKSVFLDVNTQYLKLVCYQPYDNRYNIFDQIGLVSIQVLGEP
jgi:centrosomal protein CEP104